MVVVAECGAVEPATVVADVNRDILARPLDDNTNVRGMTVPNRVGNGFRQHERKVDAQGCRYCRLRRIDRELGRTIPMSGDFSQDLLQRRLERHVDFGGRARRRLAYEFPDAPLLADKQLSHHLQACSDVAARAVGQQLYLQTSRRQALQQAIVEVARKPRPLPLGDGLLGVNRRSKLTPDRRPILTPSGDESGR